MVIRTEHTGGLQPAMVDTWFGRLEIEYDSSIRSFRWSLNRPVVPVHAERQSARMSKIQMTA